MRWVRKRRARLFDIHRCYIDQTDSQERTCSFQAPADFDVEAQLDQMAITQSKLKGWSRVD